MAIRKLVPLNCLVITVGPTPAQHEAVVRATFPEHEIISAEGTRYELVGDRARRDIDGVVFAEIHRRIETKLRLGERVVVCAANLRRDGRTALANLALNAGVPVFYLIFDDATAPHQQRQRFQSTERDALRGDGLAEVIDSRIHRAEPVMKLPRDPFEYLRERFNGITVLGDVHGMYHSLLATLDWARSRNHFVLSLGDVIDYGAGTLETADELYRVVMRGAGEMVIGNHERKIARWIDQSERGRNMMKLSEGNKVTTQALQRGGALLRDRWTARFRGFVARSPLQVQIGNFMFTHAAVHPSVWTTEPEARAALVWENRSVVENYSLFGEYETPVGNERPPRTYSWIDSIPAGQVAVVGHDARSTQRPVIAENATGGKAIFLDTGSGKGGCLSTLDLRFTDEGLRLANFNVH